MTTLADIQLISPYHPSLALNGGGFPDGFSCRHSNPIRYIVRGASHQPHSARQARPRRDRQEHAGYYRQVPEYTQLSDIVSHDHFRYALLPVQDSRVGKEYGLSLFVFFPRKTDAKSTAKIVINPTIHQSAYFSTALTNAYNKSCPMLW